MSSLISHISNILFSKKKEDALRMKPMIITLIEDDILVCMSQKSDINTYITASRKTSLKMPEN